MANVYFLILSIIQLIPGVSSVPFYSTVVPLVIVLSITAAKDAYDDVVSICVCATDACEHIVVVRNDMSVTIE